MRSVLVFVALLVVGLLAWSLTNSADAPLPSPVEPTAVETPTAAPTTGTVSMPAAAQPPAPEHAPERQLAPPPPDAPAANVRVVMFGSDVGVAGAAVRYQRPDFSWNKMTDAERQEAQQLFRDSEAFLQRYGTECTTDEAGCCFVPPGPNGARVAARSGNLYADGHVPTNAKEPTVLALRPDCTLHVLVVDAAGKPAPGIQVQARHVAGSATAKNDQQLSIWGIGESDAAGHVVQPHLQNYAFKDATLPLDLAALVPGGESPAVRIEATAPPDEVVLHLPAGGAVTVHLRDFDGKPLDLAYLYDAKVQLTVLDREPAGRRELDDVHRRPSTEAALDANADARFPCVVFDRWLVLQHGFGFEQTSCAGPTLAAPSIEVTMREGKDDVILTGTLLQPDGAPFAEQEIMVSYRVDGGSGSRTLRTDAKGRCRCNLSHFAKGPQVTLGFSTNPMTGGDGVAVELTPRPLQPGMNDLGEVHLLPFGVLVAGHLRCDDGVTATQVQLEVERKQGGRWTQEYNLRPSWQDGSFSIHSGIAAGEPLRLVVREGPYLPVEPIECKAGDADLEIHLRAAGSATATFLVDDTTPVERLTARLEPVVPKKLDPRQEMMRRFGDRFGLTAKDGRAAKAWSGLEPGSYRLMVECHGSGEPFLSLDAIQVGSGECADPRLQGIDLRGRVRELEIRATGGDGAEITDASAFVLIQGKGETWNGYSLRQGVVRIATAAAVDLMVLAKDCEMARADGVTASCTIALKPAQRAKLTVALPSPLPEGMQLQLLLLPQLGFPRRNSINLDNGRGMGIDSFFVEEVAVGADGTVEVPVRWPGEYSAEARLQKGERGGHYLRGFEPRRFTLPGTVALTVEPKGYEQTLQRAVK